MESGNDSTQNFFYLFRPKSNFLSCGLHVLLSAESVAFGRSNSYQIEELETIRKKLQVLLLYKALEYTQ